MHDVISAKYLYDYSVEVEFDDGRSGIADLSSYADRGGVFERFRDMDFFRNFRVNREFGVLEWDEGIDIAPETLYSEVTGEPLPEWMAS